jgi:hypothetical protein
MVIVNYLCSIVQGKTHTKTPAGEKAEGLDSKIGVRDVYYQRVMVLGRAAVVFQNIYAVMGLFKRRVQHLLFSIINVV